MTALQEIISSFPKSDIDSAVRAGCDLIMKEEKFEFISSHPKGANVCCVLELQCAATEMFFITLERESKEQYVICKYSRGVRKTVPDQETGKNIALTTPPLKRISSRGVKSSTAEKIIKEYVERFNFEIGG